MLPFWETMETAQDWIDFRTKWQEEAAASWLATHFKECKAAAGLHLIETYREVAECDKLIYAGSSILDL